MSVANRTFPVVKVSPMRLWVVLIVLSIGDIVTTLVGLQAGVSEGNPVVAAAISQFGAVVLVPLKGLMLAVWWAGFRALPYRWELGFLVGGTCFFGVVVLVNVGMISQHLGVW